ICLPGQQFRPGTDGRVAGVHRPSQSDRPIGKSGRLPAMFAFSNRRQFLHTLLGGAAGLAFSNQAFASLVTTKLADDFVLITGAGSNVLVVNTSDGILMVDGGAPEQSADLLNLVSGQSDPARIQVLFNTHWHLEHTGANESIGKTGAKIIAHENTKLWMGA